MSDRLQVTEEGKVAGTDTPRPMKVVRSIENKKLLSSKVEYKSVINTGTKSNK